MLWGDKQKSLSPFFSVSLCCYENQKEDFRERRFEPTLLWLRTRCVKRHNVGWTFQYIFTLPNPWSGRRMLGDLMNNGQNDKEMPASSSSDDVVPVVIQNGSTKNLEAALIAIGNAGFGGKPIKISVITIEVN